MITWHHTRDYKIEIHILTCHLWFSHDDARSPSLSSQPPPSDHQVSWAISISVLFREREIEQRGLSLDPMIGYFQSVHVMFGFSIHWLLGSPLQFNPIGLKKANLNNDPLICSNLSYNLNNLLPVHVQLWSPHINSSNGEFPQLSGR